MSRLEELLEGVRVFDEPEHLAENRLFGLHELIKRVGITKKLSTVVEIGAYSGTTTELFSLFAKEVQVYNTWKLGDQTREELRLQKAEQLFDIVASQKNSGIVKNTCNTLVEAATLVKDKSADLLYLGHLVDYTSTIEQLKAFSSKVKPEGYLAGHGLHHPAVRQAVNEFLVDGYIEFHDYSFAFQTPKAVEPVVVAPIETPHIETIQTGSIGGLKIGNVKLEKDDR